MLSHAALLIAEFTASLLAGAIPVFRMSMDKYRNRTDFDDA